MSLADLGGGGARHTPPLWDPILSFLHTFSPKSAHVGGPRPLNGCTPPPTGNPGSAAVCVDSLKQIDRYIGGNIFTCDDKSYVSLKYLCDGKNDCPGVSAADERNCSFVASKVSQTFICSLIHEVNGTKDCDFFINELQKESTQENISQKMSALNSDLNFTVRCENSKLKCSYDAAECYEIAEICLYRLNKYNKLTPCRFGGNLENCKDFECNRMFKCPDYYCIPWGYVCDGKWDCPKGFDKSKTLECGKK